MCIIIIIIVVVVVVVVATVIVFVFHGVHIAAHNKRCHSNKVHMTNSENS